MKLSAFPLPSLHQPDGSVSEFRSPWQLLTVDYVASTIKMSAVIDSAAVPIACQPYTCTQESFSRLICSFIGRQHSCPDTLHCPLTFARSLPRTHTPFKMVKSQRMRVANEKASKNIINRGNVPKTTVSNRID